MATNDVLVESFCDGVTMKEYLKENHEMDEKKYLAKLGLRAFLKMIIIDNFVHADMHAGNLLVKYENEIAQENNSKKKLNCPSLVVLDVGLTTFADESDLYLIRGLFKAIGLKHFEDASSLLIEQSSNQNKMTKADKEGFMKEMTLFFDNMYHADPLYYEGGGGLVDMLEIQKKYRVQHHGNLTTMLVGMIILEGIGKQLYSDETRIFEEALNMVVSNAQKKYINKYNIFMKKLINIQNIILNPIQD